MLLNFNKETKFSVTHQIWVTGGPVQLNRPDFCEIVSPKPVFLANVNYLPMRYAACMPVTASAYIASVNLQNPVEYRKEYGGEIFLTNEIIVVGKKFLSLNKKQQRALLLYEVERTSSTSYGSLNCQDPEISGPSNKEASARASAITSYGRAAKSVLNKINRLDRKGQIKTAKELKKFLTNRTSIDGDPSVEALIRLFETPFIGDENDKTEGLENLSVDAV